MAKKIIKGLGKVLPTLAGGIIGGPLLKSAFGGKKKSSATEDGPKVMPLADDEAVRRAKKRSLIKQMGRGGRSSTMLSNDSETLGG